MLIQVFRVPPTDGYWWSCEEAWNAAVNAPDSVEQLELTSFVVCVSLTRSKLVLDKISITLKAGRLTIAELKEALLDEAEDGTWKPAAQTYDTSTCNLLQDCKQPSYCRSIWKPTLQKKAFE